MFEIYLREIYGALGYMATWLPSEQLDAGDVGRFERNGRFRRETTLAALGVVATVAPGTATAVVKHHSAGGVSVNFKAAGDSPLANSLLSKAEAGFLVELGREHAIFFEAVGCTHERVVDVEDVGIEILARVGASLWKRDYFVITEVIRAASATILVSQGANARFEASVSAPAGPGLLSVGDAKLGLLVKHSSSLGVELAAQTALTPLFTAYHIHKTLLGGTTFIPTEGAYEGPFHPATVDEVVEASARA
jgi:hypothetical protein